MARRRKLRHVLRPLRRLAWPFQALVLAAFWALCRRLSATAGERARPRACCAGWGRG